MTIIGDRRRLIARIVAVTAVVSVLLIGAYGLNGGSLDVSDRDYYVVVSSSMDGPDTGYPIGSIPKGSLIVVDDLDMDEMGTILVGDVVAYDAGGAVVTHRVVSIDLDDGYVVVKGDMNATTETVSLGIVVGEVIGVHPWLGKAAALMHSKALFLVMELVLAVVMVSCTREILRVLREERQENVNEY